VRWPGSAICVPNLARLVAKKSLHVAHIGVLCEQALRDGEISVHVRGMDDQHKVRSRRHPPALLNGVVSHGTGFKSVELLCVLPIQRHFHQCLQAVAEFVAAQDGHLTLDPATFCQALDAPQAGGRRHMDPFSQGHIAQAGVVLECVE